MKSYLLLSICLVGLFMQAQTRHVEDLSSGIQTGLLGLWVYAEKGISRQEVLRGEVGFANATSGDPFFRNSSLLLAPVFTAEPRWYFNLDKRFETSRTTKNNSGNFLSLKTSYYPYWYVISSENRIRVASVLSLMPTWGFRRHLTKHLAFETGIGLGDRYFFLENSNSVENRASIAFHFQLRLGYTF